MIFEETYPFVSICTPTFNRRPFIPIIIKCFEHQTYPKNKIEWIIVDDGTDKIEDLVTKIPQVKYFKYENKISLGKKRNISNSKCKGDIIIYMDDDDYYPPERVSHAVETLQQNPTILCAGSSIMHIFFKHINKMYKFGPYGTSHATAATLAFRKELLNITSFNDIQCVAEEKHFLKNYTIPFVQLDTMKTILVFSHNHNSFDKKRLLDDMPNPYVCESELAVSDFIMDKEIKNFFIKDIDNILDTYEPGSPKYKTDVTAQIDEITRIKNEQFKKCEEYNNILSKLNLPKDGALVKDNNTTYINSTIKMNEMSMVINELLIENNQLKEKIQYYEDKLKKLINDQVELLKKNKNTPEVKENKATFNVVYV